MGMASPRTNAMDHPPLGNCVDREERSWVNRIGATGFEPATSASRTQRSSQAEPRPVYVEPLTLSQFWIDVK